MEEDRPQQFWDGTERRTGVPERRFHEECTVHHETMEKLEEVSKSLIGTGNAIATISTTIKNYTRFLGILWSVGALIITLSWNRMSNYIDKIQLHSEMLAAQATAIKKMDARDDEFMTTNREIQQRLEILEKLIYSKEVNLNERNRK